jgi:hypothetical protein
LHWLQKDKNIEVIIFKINAIKTACCLAQLKLQILDPPVKKVITVIHPAHPLILAPIKAAASVQQLTKPLKQPLHPKLVHNPKQAKMPPSLTHLKTIQHNTEHFSLNSGFHLFAGKNTN